MGLRKADEAPTPFFRKTCRVDARRFGFRGFSGPRASSMMDLRSSVSVQCATLTTFAYNTARMPSLLTCSLTKESCSHIFTGKYSPLASCVQPLRLRS